MKRGKALSTRNRRIDWLLVHEELWKGYPHDFTSEKVMCERRLMREMQDAGLFSMGTERGAVSWEKLISLARRQRRTQ